MFSMNFRPGGLADDLSESAGFKSGLALSIDVLCGHLSGIKHPDIIRDYEEFADATSIGGIQVAF